MTSWRMKPTTSALGVIAIIFVMITATNSEAENGIIEHGINHPGGSEEDRHLQEGEDIANETSKTVDSNARVILFPKNDTAIDSTVLNDLPYVPTIRPETANTSDTNIDTSVIEIAELQQDQSDVRTDLRSSNNLESDAMRVNSLVKLYDNTETGNSSRDKPQVTTIGDLAALSQEEGTPSRRNLVENQIMLGPKRNENLDGGQVDDQRVSNHEDRENTERTDSSRIQKPEEDISGTTMSFIQETIAVVTEIGPIEQKNVEDIRAISFQVPPPEVSVNADEQGIHQQEQQQQAKEQREKSIVEKKEEERKLMETRKDHSKPVNNLLVGSKSTKAFYEIKPSIKTEVEKGQDHQVPGTTQKALSGRKFILPSIDSAFGKFGPYFEDGDQEINITARIGSTVLLDCKIGMLGDKEVTWLQHSKDSFRLLTVGRTLYSNDQRISLNFRYPSNWRLQILYASLRDSGLYECQVATHPPLIKKINVIVTAPELTITDDSGRIVSKERHLKAGSALKLRCEARDVLESLKESVVWTRGDETLTQDVSENRTTEISAGKEILVIVSTLIVERATPRHAGNYSCVVPGKAKTTIAVHVLNGELPAAVHDGNGVSRAFLNLWLIHLTMSYVFSR